MIELAAPEEPEVSVIVLLDGAVEMAERCLSALAACEDRVPFETVVLLNDPDPELERFVRGSTRGGRVVLARANAGPGVGWNLGAAVARAPRLATLHEDSEPDPGWLPPLVEAMDEHGAGAVGPRLYNLDGSVQNCGWVLFSDGLPQPITAASSARVAAASEPTPADVLSGAATLVERDVVAAVGGWDERFHPAVFVDVDLCTAIWNLGKPVLSVPASRVRHEGGAFDRRPRSPLSGRHLRQVLVERNRKPFVKKWGAFVTERAAPPDPADPERVAAAVSAGLQLTRERAGRIAAGEWRAANPGARAERSFSGLADPPVSSDGEGGFRVAPAVEDALSAAETELISHYCLSLVRKEEEEFQRLIWAGEAVRDITEAVRQGEADFRKLQADRDEVAARLDAILNGRTWRLRTSLLRLLRRS
jgi:GT2 family glycosyltransferase